MQTNLQHGGVYTDLQSLQGIKRLGKNDPNAALREVARQFEGIFFKMVLKSMRDATVESGLFGSSQAKQYREMFDHQLSVTLGQGGKLGIADMIYRQLGGQFKTVKTATSTPVSARVSAPGQPAAVINPDAARPAAVSPAAKPAAADNSKLSIFKSPLEFIRAIYPYAKMAAQKLGISPKVLLAQAALETGWGKSIIGGGEKDNGHNYFGIKAGKSWAGTTSTVPTLEYRSGVFRKEYARFRTYADAKTAFGDYVKFLQSSGRYSAALKAQGNDKVFVTELARSGYATDPDYAKKIQRIMSGKTLTGILDRLGLKAG